MEIVKNPSMDEIRALFYGRSFLYNKQKYVVREIKDIGVNVAIITDQMTFSKLKSSIPDFIENIEFVDNDFEVKKPFVPATTSVKAMELPAMVLPEASLSMTDKLLEMANTISKGEATPELINKAKALCDIGNSVVGIERLKFDFVKLQIGK